MSEKRVTFDPKTTSSSRPMWRRVWAYLSAEERAPLLSAAAKLGAFVGGVLFVRKYGHIFVLAQWDENLPQTGAQGSSLPPTLNTALPATL